MPHRHIRFLLPPAALLLLLCWQPSRPAGAAQEGDAPGRDRVYTVQSGDTISGIARKYGLSPQDILRANALSHPDHIAAGNVLRLPVAGPRHAPTIRTQLLSAPWESTSSPEEATPEPDKNATATAAPHVEKTPRPSPEQEKDVQAPTPVKTPAPPPELTDKDLNARVVGVYKNPTLGTLRVTKTSSGINVSKDGAVIPMRHLLYATYDGADNGGIVHNVHFEFDARGVATALQYSSNGTGQVTFAKATN